MSERDESLPAPEMRLKALLCKRTGEQVAPAEHAGCPYCFGRLSEVEKGDHGSFCDYHPDQDPMHFGFPPGAARDRSG